MSEQTAETEQTEEQAEGVPSSNLDEGSAGRPGTDDDPETFPAEYVRKLREEAATHRVRASDRDALAERLHVALVTATGRLADPSDLAFDDAHLSDVEELSTAIDELLTRKPHLASRRIAGDVGQGATQGDTAVDLAGMLRRNAT